MKKIIFIIQLVLLTTGIPVEILAQQQRFPKPEFQTEYQIPETTVQDPRAPFMDYVDLALLIAVMAVSIWFIFKKRSRKGIFWIGIFSLLYFGFYREGCICAVGSVQNLSLALFNNSYVVPITALGFFIIPLVVSLFYGRIFCASACPLGIIQDIFIVKPIRIASWLQTTMGIIPYLYLGFAILFAATGAGFIICRYDPFIGFFRLGAEFHMIVLGVFFLATGMFVARPYCRFVCPYGALLNITSRFSQKHLSITPENCVNCHLCKDSCPFDAIDKPTDEKEQKLTKKFSGKFLLFAALIPFFMFFGGWAVSGSYKTLSKVHPDVTLVSLIIANPEVLQDAKNIDVQTFLTSGKTMENLVKNAATIQQKFKLGGWWLGGFIGLVIALTLLNQMIFRNKDIYEANRGTCFSCARCLDYCPVGKPDHPYHQQEKQNPGIES